MYPSPGAVCGAYRAFGVRTNIPHGRSVAIGPRAVVLRRQRECWRCIHEAVQHDADEYVRGNVHTNGIENFWSLLKRSLKGTYVSVEPFHLFRYLDEEAFRYNNRKTDDGTRFQRVARAIIGKRLTYAQLTGVLPPAAV